MTLHELALKIIPVTRDELKCALDKQMRDQMRKEVAIIIKAWVAGKVFDKDGDEVPDVFKIWR